jgi:hypothetical protein
LRALERIVTCRDLALMTQPAVGEFLSFKRGMAEYGVRSAEGLVEAVAHHPEKVRLEAECDLRFAKAVAAEWGC